MSVAELVARAEQNMQICNACRYCEAFCAVFPAMERRLTFAENDLHYLANLCHNCGACYYACQYAPPHEFNVNVPKNFGDLRAETYKRYAWPEAFGALYARNGIAVSLITAASLALVLLLTMFLQKPEVVFAAHPGGNFYAVIPHGVMAWSFGLVSLFVLLAFTIGFTRFWRDMGEKLSEFARPVTLAQATWDALRLRYLDGGPEGDTTGCTYPTETPSSLRRVFHHFTFYGFMLCFAATCVATFYHYVLKTPAPYPVLSLPVLLGIAGGIGLLIGPVGLVWLKHQADPDTRAPAQRGMDAGFLVLLFLTSLTGLALLVLRESAAMGVLLAVHLGIVLALFLTLPYGKFVHAIYRFAALVRYALERSRPAPNVSFE
ncbi:MAG: tricarballylate utilization 4Fe-4S protein TcuB [Burkholderiales bacterium]